MLEARLHIKTDAEMTEVKNLILALKVLHTLGVSESVTGVEGAALIMPWHAWTVLDAPSKFGYRTLIA